MYQKYIKAEGANAEPFEKAVQGVRDYIQAYEDARSALENTRRLNKDHAAASAAA